NTDLLWTNGNGAASVWTMDGLNATSIVDHGPYAGWKLDELQPAVTTSDVNLVGIQDPGSY
ncbi:hypothetical protein, partial [Malikia granosa]